MKKALLTFALVTVATIGARAAVVEAWDMSGVTSPATLTANGGIDPGLDLTAGRNTLSRNTVPNPGTTNSFAGNGWNLTNTFDQTSKYFTFNLAPQAGNTLNLTSLNYAVNGSNTGPGTGRWGYSLDGGTTFTFSADFTIPFTINQTLFTWDFNDFSTTTPVEFRFWAFGATGIGGGTTASAAAGSVRLANTTGGNDLILNGSVDIGAVPEPATVGLIGLGLVGVAAFARRRSHKA
jgi:hypothetical protein